MISRFLPGRVLRAAFVVGFIFASFHVPARAAPAEVAGDIVELPQFVVTEQRELPPPENWRYAATPTFEILSSLSERETRRFVRDFHLLQQVVEVVWPAVSRVRQGPPGLLILCNRDGEFASFLPQERHDKIEMPSSVFLQEGDRAGVVVDFVPGLRLDTTGGAPATAEDGEDGAAAEPGFMEEDDPYRQFYLQYFRALLRRAAGEPPFWLEEGLVNLLASMNFSTRFEELGRVGEGSSLDFKTQLHRTALLPFAEIFAGWRPGRPEERRYSAQCYAFVHFSMYGDNQRHRPAFQKLIERAVREPVTEEVFKACYGMTYKQLAIAIRGYTEFTNYKHVQLRAKKGAAGFDVQEFPVRAATQAEVGRIKGEVFRMAGYPERARPALIAPYVRGERDPALLAALGLHELQEGTTARARTFLEAAAKGELRRPEAWVALARLRFAEAKAAPAGGEGRFSATQVSAVREPLLKARETPPPQAVTYEELAMLWLEASQAPGALDLAVLYEGVQLFPTRMKLLYMVASIACAYGEPADARALVEHGLEHAPESVRAHFVELKATLPAVAAPAAAPAAKGS